MIMSWFAVLALPSKEDSLFTRKPHFPFQLKGLPKAQLFIKEPSNYHFSSLSSHLLILSHFQVRFVHEMQCPPYVRFDLGLDRVLGFGSHVFRTPSLLVFWGFHENPPYLHDSNHESQARFAFKGFLALPTTTTTTPPPSPPQSFVWWNDCFSQSNYSLLMPTL